MSKRRRHRTNLVSGCDVALSDGGTRIGSVRDLLLWPAPLLLINVEGGGDFRVDLGAVTRVSPQRVVLRWELLDEALQEAIRHISDREDFPPPGQDVHLLGLTDDTSNEPDRYATEPTPPPIR